MRHNMQHNMCRILEDELDILFLLLVILSQFLKIAIILSEPLINTLLFLKVSQKVVVVSRKVVELN